MINTINSNLITSVQATKNFFNKPIGNGKKTAIAIAILATAAAVANMTYNNFFQNTSSSNPPQTDLMLAIKAINTGNQYFNTTLINTLTNNVSNATNSMPPQTITNTFNTVVLPPFSTFTNVSNTCEQRPITTIQLQFQAPTPKQNLNVENDLFVTQQPSPSRARVVFHNQKPTTTTPQQVADFLTSGMNQILELIRTAFRYTTGVHKPSLDTEKAKNILY